LSILYSSQIFKRDKTEGLGISTETAISCVKRLDCSCKFFIGCCSCMKFFTI